MKSAVNTEPTLMLLALRFPKLSTTPRIRVDMANGSTSTDGNPDYEAEDYEDSISDSADIP